MAKSKNEKLDYQLVDMKSIREPKFIARYEIDKDEMELLCESIKMYGLIQAIRLKPVRGGYEIVAGHRRYLAHKKLKLDKIKAEIVDAGELDQEVVKMHENKVRVQLSDIEEAKSFEHLKKISKYTNKQIAKHAGVSEGYVTQKLAILNYPDFLYNALATDQISFSAARELVRITDKIVLQEYVEHAVRSGITPKVAKQWVEDWFVMSKAGEEQVEDLKRESGVSGDQSIRVPCFICGNHFKVENTVMIRVDNDCLEDLKAAMKIKSE